MNKRTKFGILGFIILIIIFIVINTYLYPHTDIRPPPASLAINGNEQVSGIGSYCWNEALKSVCADMIGIITPKEPLPASSPFTAHLVLPLKEPPEELHFNVIRVTDDEEIKSHTNYSRVWNIRGEKIQEGNYSNLTPERESDINLSLLPGLYVIEVYPRWKEKGSLAYGFLVDVE
ncbi:MAG: hypothetical protein WA130_21735 [Candidatus Methanoperedens sp.]